MKFWSRPESDVQEQVEPLNEAELAWVAENVSVARETVKELGLADDGEVEPESLDELWARLRSEPGDPNQAINVVGLALGQLLVTRFGLEWVALTDEHGTEVAVRGPSNFTVFPTNFIAKRYESGETGFISPFVDEVEKTLGQLA
jgi:hypothetical protein